MTLVCLNVKARPSFTLFYSRRQASLEASRAILREEGDLKDEVRAGSSSLSPLLSHPFVPPGHCQAPTWVLLVWFELKIRPVVSISDSPLITTCPATATPRKGDRPSRRKDLREAPGPWASAADLLPGIMWLPSALTVGICASSFGGGLGGSENCSLSILLAGRLV